ncbi:NUDIX hydrolase [Mesobacillus maritimus]|uniref:NUDIX hydrolase n=1 Tax=Mesobacillus maritimus TaxID=1643336 RepID=A0ABS7K1E4_9BACI|nr:NUDIX hydrolase [Mesobacillus maritimus]MBY0095985.1 NUDIX hydrolase [Mesobacillus maritimus]
MDAVFKVDTGVFNFRVAGVMIENNHVLLHKQMNDDHWALPGGRVKVLEESASGVKRELMEELGVAVEIVYLLWVTENFFTYNEAKFHEIGFYYLVSSEKIMNHDEAFSCLEGDGLLYQWIPIDQLDEITLYPEFLKTSLKELPPSTQHIIIK